MFSYLLLGAGLGLTAAIQPGSLQAFLVSRITSIGWRRTLPACLAPLVSDGPIAFLALFVLGQVPRLFQDVLRGTGGVLLLYLAWVAFGQWRRPDEADAGVAAPRTFFEAVLVNLFNPNPYLGWALILGPLAIKAWRESPPYAVAFVGAFYGTLVAATACFIFLVGSARFLGPRAQRVLLGLSALILAGLGVFLLLSVVFQWGGTVAPATP